MEVGCQPYAPAAFTPRKCCWYSFLLEAESTPGPWCDRKDFMSMRNPLTLAGIEPATFRFVAQHLNHCATAVPRTPHVRGLNFGLMTSHRYGGVQFFFNLERETNIRAVFQIDHGVFLHDVFKYFFIDNRTIRHYITGVSTARLRT